MKVLFIGGTGNISLSCSQLAISRGIDLYLLCRGFHKTDVAGARYITADITDRKKLAEILRDHEFDVVVNWIAFTVSDVAADYELFRDKTDQYIFISSASAYQKPPVHPVITESTPLRNPFWQYSRDKIACEEFLYKKYRENDFPVTIVRPSLTYRTVFPIAAPGWDSYTIIDRMLKGKYIFVHGDGTSLWTLTHADDFAKGFTGLLGNIQAIGHAFHITSDEILTWNQIYRIMADAVGVEAKLVPIPSDFIASVDSETGMNLLGDKAYNMIFDNSKIKRFVPDYKADIPFFIGIRKVLAWFEEHNMKTVDQKIDEKFDKIVQAYRNP